MVVGNNLFGDILSDLGPAVTGTIAVAPGANINREDFLVKPVHGSAPDIAGQGLPIRSARLVGAMMLEHLGEQEAADAIVKAIETVLWTERATTGGTATTEARRCRRRPKGIQGMHARYFEGFKVTTRSRPARYPDRGQRSTSMAYDPQPIHTDREASKKGIHGDMISSGLQTLGLANRLWIELGLMGRTTSGGRARRCTLAATCIRGRYDAYGGRGDRGARSAASRIGAS